ncbi:SOS response-associated peptidase [Patescibacteria group bacterium]
MCGRYIFAEETTRIYKRYNIKKEPSEKQLKLDPAYNIAPGSLVPVITRNSPNRIEIMKWGLIPHWAKDPRIGYKLINARAESVHIKPSFKSSFNTKRCLIPATGFYEWKKTNDSKMPYLIQLKSRKVFSFAGLYDIWKDAENKKFRTFTIITTQPNKLMEPIHNRMPVILDKTKEEIWLNNNSALDILLNLLKPFKSSELESFPVSTDVNNPKNQGINLTKKV